MLPVSRCLGINDEMGKRDKRKSKKAPDAGKAKSTEKDKAKAAKKLEKDKAKEALRLKELKNKQQQGKGKGKGKTNKQGKGNKVESDSDAEEDLEAILEQLRADQEARVKVTNEIFPNGPSPRIHASFTASPTNPQEILLFGGEHFDGKHLHFFNDLFVYNAQREEWRLITSPNSPGPRSSHQAVATPQGKIFLFGGEFASKNQTNFLHYRDFWCLDTKTFAWEKLEVGKLPSPRSGHRMCLHRGALLLFGGFNDTGTHPTYLDDLWIFPFSEYRWHKVELPLNLPKPQPRSGHQFISLADGSVWLYGGYARIPKHAEQRLREGHTFDDGWLLKTLPPPPAGANTPHPDIPCFKWELKLRRAHPDVGIRSGATMVPFKGDRVALFGGVRDVDEDEESIEGVMLGDLWVWAPGGNRWYQMRVRTKDLDAGRRKRAEKKAKRKEQQKMRKKGGKEGSGSESDDEDEEGEGDADERPGTPRSPTGRELPADADAEMAPAAAAVDPNDDEDGWAEWEEKVAREEAEELAAKAAQLALAQAAKAQAAALALTADSSCSGSLLSNDTLSTLISTNPAPTTTTTPQLDPDAPPPRFSAHLAVQRNHLYLFGGIQERSTDDGDLEFSLDDMWVVNLDKADGWRCLKRWDDEGAKEGWVGEREDEDDGEEDDGEDKEEDGKEDGEKDEEESEEPDSEEESSSSSDSDAPPTPLSATPTTTTRHHDDPESEANAPRYSEPLKDYYARTRTYWTSVALKSSEEALTIGGEKGLRAGAFELAKIEWEAMQPELERQRELLGLDEEEAGEMRGQGRANNGGGKGGKGGGAGRSSARK